MSTPAIQQALEHYRSKWERVALGEDEFDSILPEWETEKSTVSAGAFASVLSTSFSVPGISGAGQKEFEQGALLEGLKLFRAEHDEDWAAAIFAPPAVVRAPQRMGITVQIGV